MQVQYPRDISSGNNAVTDNNFSFSSAAKADIVLSNIFKNNPVYSVLLIVILVIFSFLPVVSGSALVLPKDAEGAVYESLFGYSENRWMLLTASFVCMTGGAFLFNYIINSNETLTRVSFFPAFLVVLLSSEAFSSYAFHPALAANILIILGMMRMMLSYRENEAKALFFDGAFLISSASLFYFPSITLLPMVFICLLILRPFIWREWAMALIGIAGPHILAASVMYVLGRLDRYYNRGMFAGFSIQSFKPAYASQYFVLFCLGFLFLLVAFKKVSGGAARKIRQQKNINILSFWIMLGIGGIFYENPYMTSVPLLSVPPIAGILSEWLGNFKKSTLSDFAVVLLLSAFALSVMQIRGVF